LSSSKIHQVGSRKQQTNDKMKGVFVFTIFSEYPNTLGLEVFGTSESLLKRRLG